MTKISKYIFIVIILFGILGPISSLQAQTTVTRRCTTSDFEKVVEGNPPREVLKKKASSRCDESDPYILLEKLPGTDKIDVANPNALGDYLNIMIKIVIGLAAVLAVFMIFLGGIQYMTSEVISSKEDGKNRIRNAIFGLLIALGAYTILYTINPDLLNSNLDSMKEVVLENIDTPESSLPFAPINQQLLRNLGISCDRTGGAAALVSVSKSFMGKSTYSQEKRNTADANTAYFDCSSYAAQVYNCVGLPIPGNNSREIFSGQSPVVLNGTKANGVELKVGDLLGWVQGGNEKFGHVVMYIGGGQVIDSQGRRPVNQAVQIVPLTSFGNRIKYINRIEGGGSSGSW